MALSVKKQQNMNLQYCLNLTSVGDTGVHALISKTKHGKVNNRYDKDIIDLFRYANYDVDYYVTVNTFKHWSHSLDEIVGLSGNFIDIDTELHGIRKEQFEGFLDDILDELSYCPKHVVYSGHGFHFVYPYVFQVKVNNIAMVTLWDLVENKIIHELNHVLYQYFGLKNLCDNKSTDCSRSLRMPGTRNHKNRKDIRNCDVIKINNIRSQFSFFDLVNEYLPKYDKNKTRRVKKQRYGKSNLKYNPITLKLNRTHDFKKLLNLREYDITGMRESFLYIFACNAGYYMSNDDTIKAIESLNSEFTEPLPERELRGLKSEIKHLDLTQWQHKNKKLIADLEITSNEQRQLTTIISKSEKYRRRNAKRNKQGCVKSSQIKRKKTFRNKQIVIMYQKGNRISTISKKMKISRPTVYKAIRACK